MENRESSNHTAEYEKNYQYAKKIILLTNMKILIIFMSALGFISTLYYSVYIGFFSELSKRLPYNELEIPVNEIQNLLKIKFKLEEDIVSHKILIEAHKLSSQNALSCLPEIDLAYHGAPVLDAKDISQNFERDIDVNNEELISLLSKCVNEIVSPQADSYPEEYREILKKSSPLIFRTRTSFAAKKSPSEEQSYLYELYSASVEFDRGRYVSLNKEKLYEIQAAQNFHQSRISTIQFIILKSSKYILDIIMNSNSNFILVYENLIREKNDRVTIINSELRKKIYRIMTSKTAYYSIAATKLSILIAILYMIFFCLKTAFSHITLSSDKQILMTAISYRRDLMSEPEKIIEIFRRRNRHAFKSPIEPKSRNHLFKKSVDTLASIVSKKV